MDDRISSLFSNAANSLNILFKEGSNEIENSKQRGKKDLYQESLKWMLESNNGDLKFVRIDELINILRSQSPQHEFNRSNANMMKKYKPCND